jgi:hypothetical protein
MATSLLAGGYVFGASSGQLQHLLYLSIATGIGLVLIETYPSLHFIFEGWGLFLLAKLVLLHFAVVVPDYRVPLILAVIALAGIGSHLPARFRHYSVLEGKVIDR